MASLSDIGKIYNLSTKEVLCRYLEDFENITKELFDAIGKAYSQKVLKNDMSDSIMKLVDQLIDKDAQIKGSIITAQKQLEKHKKINQLKEELAKKDQEILQLLSQLKEAESILATAIFQAQKKLEVTEQAKNASVSCEELIKFAFRISSGNSVEAPPDWVPGDPRRPYPLDIEMRCGALGQLSQKGVLESGLVTESVALGSLDTSTSLNMDEDIDGKKSVESQDSLSVRTDSSSSRNGGIWQGPPTEDNAHLATMPVSAMMSHSTNNGVSALEEPHLAAMPVSAMMSHPTNNIEVGYMSTSSESSSSGESS